MYKKEDRHKNSHIQTKRKTYRYKDREKERQALRHTDRQKQRQTYRHKDKEKKRQNLEFQILTRFEVKDIIRNKVC